MALSNKEKQQALRKRRARLGLKRKEFYLTDEEAKKVKGFISKIRMSDGFGESISVNEIHSDYMGIDHDS